MAIFTATYGHIYRYERTYLPLPTAISTATYGNINSADTAIFTAITATNGHIYRCLLPYLPLLTDISTADTAISKYLVYR
jgi:hypothetical protein